jgi:hypothetical protein
MGGLLHAVGYEPEGALDHPAVIQADASIVSTGKAPDLIAVPDALLRQASMDR